MANYTMANHTLEEIKQIRILRKANKHKLTLDAYKNKIDVKILSGDEEFELVVYESECVEEIRTFLKDAYYLDIKPQKTIFGFIFHANLKEAYGE